MNAFGEKSMLVITALALALIIIWLIGTDSGNADTATEIPHDTGIEVSAADQTT